MEGAETMLSERGEGAWQHGGDDVCGHSEGDGGLNVVEVRMSSRGEVGTMVLAK